MRSLSWCRFQCRWMMAAAWMRSSSSHVSSRHCSAAFSLQHFSLDFVAQFQPANSQRLALVRFAAEYTTNTQVDTGPVLGLDVELEEGVEVGVERRGSLVLLIAATRRRGRQSPFSAGTRTEYVTSIVDVVEC